MIPRCLRDSVSLLLELAVVLIIVRSTSSMKQCKRKNIRNLGIKLCQMKCNENNLCSDFEYHVESLPCPLLRHDSKKIEEQAGTGGISRNRSNVLIDACASKACRPELRCLDTRPGKAICERDEKRNYPQKHLTQLNLDKNELFGQWRLPLSLVFVNACRNGDLKEVRNILQNSLIDINNRAWNHGITPLMVAAQEGHCRVFDYLIKKGANMSHVDNDGKSFLHWAYTGGHEGMVECILRQYRIQMNNVHASHFMQVAERGLRDVLEFLVCMGANVSQVDSHGNNVLHWACHKDHVSLAKYILSQGVVDINGRGRYGVTPLIVAAKYGNRDVFEFLVCMGANMSQLDSRGNNVLHWACLKGHVSITKYILSQGVVDINGRGKYGITPLMVAATYGNRDVFEFLVCMGANVSHVDDNLNNVLHRASDAGQAEIVKNILSKDMVNVNSRGVVGVTPLMKTAQKGRIDIFDQLVRKGAATRLVDANGNNILHLASWNGHLEMVKHIVLKNMTDINAKNKEGETAATIAGPAKNLDLYNFLVSQGCQVK